MWCTEILCHSWLDTLWEFYNIFDGCRSNIFSWWLDTVLVIETPKYMHFPVIEI